MAEVEGLIKYRLNFKSAPPPPVDIYESLEKIRTKLIRKRWIGVNSEDTGYGNLSILTGENFVITGSQTGHLKELSPGHYTTVTGYDLAENRITAAGPLKPSSESLTHAAIYSSGNHEIQSVIHIHDDRLFNRYYDKLPTTAADIQYGTPEMAQALRDGVLKQGAPGLVIMGGHPGGIIAYGGDINRVYRYLCKSLSVDL